MNSHNIPKNQQARYENERRDSLARYLIHCKRDRQISYLKTLKSDVLREDLKERMRQELAKEIAAMPSNIRNLRLSRLQQRCQNRAFDYGFFQDILARVKTFLNEDHGNG